MKHHHNNSSTNNHDDDDNRNNNNNNNNQSLLFTTSADEILDVTPVQSPSSSFDEGSNKKKSPMNNNNSNSHNHYKNTIDHYSFDDDYDDDDDHNELSGDHMNGKNHDDDENDDNESAITEIDPHRLFLPNQNKNHNHNRVMIQQIQTQQQQHDDEKTTAITTTTFDDQQKNHKDGQQQQQQHNNNNDDHDHDSNSNSHNATDDTSIFSSFMMNSERRNHNNSNNFNTHFTNSSNNNKNNNNNNNYHPHSFSQKKNDPPGASSSSTNNSHTAVSMLNRNKYQQQQQQQSQLSYKQQHSSSSFSTMNRVSTSAAVDSYPNHHHSSSSSSGITTTPATSTNNKSMSGSSTGTVSEWDKVMRSGKPSIGRADPHLFSTKTTTTTTTTPSSTSTTSNQKQQAFNNHNTVPVTAASLPKNRLSHYTHQHNKQIVRGNNMVVVQSNAVPRTTAAAAAVVSNNAYKPLSSLSHTTPTYGLNSHTTTSQTQKKNDIDDMNNANKYVDGIISNIRQVQQQQQNQQVPTSNRLDPPPPPLPLTPQQHQLPQQKVDEQRLKELSNETTGTTIGSSDRVLVVTTATATSNSPGPSSRDNEEKTTSSSGYIKFHDNNNNHSHNHYPPPPPPPSVLQHQRPNSLNQSQHRKSSIGSVVSNTNSTSHSNLSSGNNNNGGGSSANSEVGSTTGTSVVSSSQHNKYNTSASDHLSAGVLPDVLMNVRQKIESMTLFDSDILRMMSADYNNTTQNDGSMMMFGEYHEDPTLQESRESLKRSSQQSISASVLVSLAHKRYERRRLAAMEIEKVVRSLVVQYQQQKNKYQQQLQQQQQSKVAATATSGGAMTTITTSSSSQPPISDVSLDRIHAILLLLSDDYVRSTSEDARKGGVVALAACAIGLKKADDYSLAVQECRDLILASVVHACQDHSQRVRYYATESLFNVVKVIPSFAVQHFFILFEILRSLYADVDVDVRSGAELLDKKLKEIIVGAMNAGIFTADSCVPVFSRFVFMKHKATKRLTLTWLQELNEKLIGAPILEFLHLFLGGIFDMVADPTVEIQQSALAFLQSVLPKLLVVHVNGNEGSSSSGGGGEVFDCTTPEDDVRVDFDKILQSLVTTMEHPNPFVRKVAMYWMSRIVKAHMMTKIIILNQTTGMNHHSNKVDGTTGSNTTMVPYHATTSTTPTNTLSTPLRESRKKNDPLNEDVTTGEIVPSKVGDSQQQQQSNTTVMNSPTTKMATTNGYQFTSPASIAVRNAVPHVLPGVLLSIGDPYNHKANNNQGTQGVKDAFLPDQTTRDLAEQTNACLQEAVRKDGSSYVQLLDGFIVALREELDSPGGYLAKNAPAVYRTPYRMDVASDGTGVETAGWFHSSRDGSNSTDTRSNDSGSVMSRLCALHWIIVLYESVVPDLLKADYAREFIFAIIHQLADHPPQSIVFKSLEVLAKITIPVSGEERPRSISSHVLSGFGSPAWKASSISGTNTEYFEDHSDSPLSDSNVAYALKFLDSSQRRLMSRDREVYSSLVQLFSYNEHLLTGLSSVITYMCKLQPPAFVMASFAVELERFIRRRQQAAIASPYGVKQSTTNQITITASDLNDRDEFISRDLRFVSSFIQHMSHVLLSSEEAKDLRMVLKDCVGDASNNHGTVTEKERQLSRLFNILLHAFSHNIAAVLSLCLWSSAYRTAYLFVTRINPLDINLMFLLEIDRLVEMLERPLFRHLHIRMLERDQDVNREGSGSMLFQFLKCLLMIVPQSTCYRVLRDRLTSLSRFRQSTGSILLSAQPTTFGQKKPQRTNTDTKLYVTRIEQVRELHCNATWKTIRMGSLEIPPRILEGNTSDGNYEPGAERRKWLGYSSKEEEEHAAQRYQDEKMKAKGQSRMMETTRHLSDLASMGNESNNNKINNYIVNHREMDHTDDDIRQQSQQQRAAGESKDNEQRWMTFWSSGDQ